MISWFRSCENETRKKCLNAPFCINVIDTANEMNNVFILNI